MAAGSSAVLSSFILNLVICVLCFVSFGLLRSRSWSRRFFAPRRYAGDLELRPAKLPDGVFGWIAPVVVCKEKDIIDEAGLDCAIYLRILTFGLYLFCGLSVWCLLAILPANLTSDEIDRLLSQQAANSSSGSSPEYRFTDFDKYSLSNVAAGSPKMWVHLASIYFVVFFTLWLLSRFNRESVLLRLMFLGNAKKGGPSHTVLCTDVPAVREAVAKTVKQQREASASSRTPQKAVGESSEDTGGPSTQLTAVGPQRPRPHAWATPDSTPTGKGAPTTVVEDLSRVTEFDSAAGPSSPALAEIPVLPSSLHPGADLGEPPPAGPAGLPDHRAANRYDYDLADSSLDPKQQAEQKLQSGLTPAELVKQEFELVYSPANVAAVNMVQDTSALEPLAEEYNKVMEQLEDCLDMVQLRLKLRKGIEHKTKWVLGAVYGDWGKEELGTKWFKKVDAMDFWTKRLKFLRERIVEEQEKATKRAAPSAFVTFSTRMAQAVGSSSLHHHDVDTWIVQGAPAPFEVVWKNLGMSTQDKRTRQTTLWVVFWLMTLFFMIPVAAIQVLIEVPKLASIPVLGDIVTAPVIRQLLEAIVPGLVLKIFLAVVPIILRFMAILSGATSLSEVDFGVVKRFFLFQVVVVFFGNIIAGSFFNQLTQWVENPTTVIPILGKAIPMTSTFFITYLFTNGLGVKSIAFIRLPGFVIYWLLSKFAGSPRARQRLWMYQYTDNGTTVVDHTITMLIGIVFSCMNPIVCPAALAYFIVTYIGERYNNIYVFRRSYESAGKLWQTVYNQVVIGLYIMQLTMLGLLAIKQFKYTPLGLPPLAFTIVSHLNTLRRYRRPWSVTSLHDAAELDAWEAQHKKAPRQVLEGAPSAAEEGRALLPAAPGEMQPMEEETREVKDIYKNPCFKIELSRLDAVEALALDLRPRLDALNTWTAELQKQGGREPPPAGTVGSAGAAGAGSFAGPSTALHGKEGDAEKAAAASGSGGGSGVGVAVGVPPEVTWYDSRPDLDGPVGA